MERKMRSKNEEEEEEEAFCDPVTEIDNYLNGDRLCLRMPR